MSQYLIAGLGNPGKQYQDSRHNLGFMVVDEWATRLGSPWECGPGPYDWIRLKFNQLNVVLIKPSTFMNRSGVAVADARLRFEIPFNQCLIVLDDLALPLGQLRLRARGSDGGHRGLASIIRYLHSREIPRLRMGIGNSQYDDTVSYVLSPFKKENIETVQIMTDMAVQAIEKFIMTGIQETMNAVN